MRGRRKYNVHFIFMRYQPTCRKLLIYITILVWTANGLVKIFDLVHRHQLIVARILGSEFASILTKTIGISELLMAGWILSAIKPNYCKTLQIIIVATMNILEFFIAPDLLLFGKMNILFAFIFILIIYFSDTHGSVSKKSPVCS